MSSELEELKTAAKKIKLTEDEKAQIVAACRSRRRKRNPAPWIAAAAVFVVLTAVMIAPGFLFRAKNAAPEADGVMYAADEETPGSAKGEDGFLYSKNKSAFESPEEAETVSLTIPAEFSRLVPAEDFIEWVRQGGSTMEKFVEHFGISKEDFEAANSLYGERNGESFNIEDFYSE